MNLPSDVRETAAVRLGVEPLAEPLEPSAYRAFRLCDECRTQTASVYATSLPLSCSFARLGLLGLETVVVLGLFYANLVHEPEENSRTKNDLGSCGLFRHTCAIAEVGEPKSQLCTAAAAAPLLVLQGVPAQQRAESPVHAPLPASIMALASAEMEHPIAIGTAQAHLSIADPGTVNRASESV